MSDRDCKNCLYARTPDDPNDNGCTAWECEYINRKEAIKEWKRTRWIPCKKDVPKDEGEYLVYCYSDFGPWGFNMILHWCDGWNCFKDCRENEIKNVVAWMHLPEAYKGE